MSIKRLHRAFRLFLALSILALFIGCGGGSSGGDAARTNADLAALELSSGTINPGFSSDTLSYAMMFVVQSSVTVTPSACNAEATITVNGEEVATGQETQEIAFDPGPNTIEVIVTAADGITTKTYTITATYLSQEAYIKASNTRANDYFGMSISISGDTLAVGSRYEDSSATGIDGDQANAGAYDSGAVYIFTRSGTTWVQQAYLKASNTEAGDYFGYSVSLSGDTLAVGAIGEDGNATVVDGNQGDNSAFDSGAVYVFTRSGTTWTQQAYIKASNTEAGDWFGHSVSLSGDTLVVGADGEDSNATGVDGDQNDNSEDNSGAAYVFARSGTTWTQQAYLKASNTRFGNLFGTSVSLSGDTLAVGAPYETSNATGVDGDQDDNSALFSGAVYIFIRDGAAWTRQAYIKASNTDQEDEFGTSVSLSGNTLAVGAPLEASSATGVDGDQTDNSTLWSGAVYVFTRSGTTWTQQAYIKASNTDQEDRFGWSVSLSGDTLAMGAFIEKSNATGVNGDEADNSASGSGAVYLFTRSGAAWAQQAYIKASNTEAGDFFGCSVSLSGGTLAVGAYSENSNATGIDGDQDDNSIASGGAVYLFE